MLAASTDNPTALLLLVLVVPLLVALVFAYRRSQRDLAALQRLVHTSPAAAARAVTVLRLKRCADGVLTVVAVTSVIFAAAGVRWGEGMVEDTTTGHEVVVLLDLSRSMSAQDALPSRLGQGLAALDTLLEQLPGTRFALVGFSDAAHLLVPFTDDRQALRQQLTALREATPALGASGIAAALRYVTEELPGRAGARRTVVLVSDGESSTGDPLPVALRAGRAGIAIVTVAVGSAAGAAVPDRRGDPLQGAAGAVRSARDDRALEAVARLSGGLVADPLLPDTMADAVTWLRARRHGEASVPTERLFRVARAPASRAADSGGAAGVGCVRRQPDVAMARYLLSTAPVVALVLLTLAAGGSREPRLATLTGNYAFARGDYVRATSNYLNAGGDTERAHLTYNLGNTYLALGEIDAGGGTVAGRKPRERPGTAVAHGVQPRPRRAIRRAAICRRRTTSAMRCCWRRSLWMPRSTWSSPWARRVARRRAAGRLRQSPTPVLRRR